MIPLKFRFILVDQLGGLVQQRLFFLGPTGKKKVTFFFFQNEIIISLYIVPKKNCRCTAFLFFYLESSPAAALRPRKETPSSATPDLPGSGARTEGAVKPSNCLWQRAGAV